MKINDLEKKILFKIYELDAFGSQKLVLKDTIEDFFPENKKEVMEFLEKLETNGFIKSPAKSFSFHFTKEGINYCKQFFI